MRSRNANVHLNASFFGEMTFILVNSGTSKRQEKQLFADWRPVILKTKRSQLRKMFYRMTAEKFEYETNSTHSFC